MGQANPFIRFGPVGVNGGFSPGIEYVSGILQSLETDIAGESFIGLSAQQAIGVIKALIAPFNESPYFAGVRLVYPSPWPTISGTQTLTFYVRNDQLYATIPAQQITIALDLSDAVIDGQSVAYPGVPSVTADYTTPLYSVEKQVIRALEIYDQNGAAFFPDPYLYSGGTVLSGLWRTPDYEFTTRPVRDPLVLLPYEPIQTFTLDALDKEETYILSLIGKIIRFGLENDDITDITDYINSLSLPDGYSLTLATVSTDRIEATFNSSGYSFKAVGMFDTSGIIDRWRWQRFTAPGSAPASSFLTVFGTSFPYQPNSGLLYQTYWYDMEQVCFSDGCEVEEEGYQIPAKTGDTWNFNVLPYQANLLGLTSVLIGLFDSDNNFIQEVGSATIPFANQVYTITISGSQKATIVSDIASNMVPTLFIGIDSSGGETTLITVPFADTDTGSVDLYAQSIVDYINALGGYDASFVNGTDLVFTIEISGPYNGSVSLLFSAYTHQIDGSSVEACPATQAQAEITIPPVADGCYRLGIYNIDTFSTSVYELFALSNAIQVNNADCFSTIIEFGGEENEIVQGFEYFNGWLQRIRVDLNGGGEKPKIEEDIYRNSDGTFQRPAHIEDLSIDLHTEYLDLPTQKAMYAATRHPVLVWKGQNISVQGDLDTATVQDYTNETSFRNRSQMRFQALLQGFQPENDGCINC